VAIEGQRQLGDLFTLRLLGHELVVMCHPDHAEQVLFTHKDRYIKGQGYDAFRLLVGQGLITLEEGDTWRRARRLAAPPFLKARVGRHLEAMRAAAEAVAARWAALPAGTEVDLSEEMAQFAMRVVLSTVMPLQGAEDLGRLHQVLLEGLMLSGAGIAGGLLLGVVTARWLNTILRDFPGLPAVFDFFVWSPGAAWRSLALLRVSGTCAGLLPAWRASSTPVAAALREEAIG
jgi:cytochrome P450